MHEAAAFSEYIIYADESGSPVLGADASDFPIFVLVFLIVRKSYYAGSLVPQFQALKFETVGHDQLILHERDIRRQSGAFAFLQVSVQTRAAFIGRLTKMIEEADIHLCCAIIDKEKLAERYSDPWSPYDLALTFCIEKAAKFLQSEGENGHAVHVLFEARGQKEDRHLELEFRRIAAGQPKIGRALPVIQSFNWQPMFVDKRSNSTGLQIADLAARPLGLAYLRPDQENRAAKVLQHKMVFPHPKCFP
ncbi:DUF3800 domain-containing protein [Gemmobacter lutimaris]|uniref:DUF3800 domain-containing protein n=1 Tax=Gemmobacter lutimaris TaxID=2306023 RepID=A0A398BSG3_9RHOB|nr:DUF3800 domain-containing protein [Gemmobacter lutimaris]RID92447.1 DUF3800 domain-containing protein [Gemmobacter lutimaris]